MLSMTRAVKSTTPITTQTPATLSRAMFRGAQVSVFVRASPTFKVNSAAAALAFVECHVSTGAAA